MKNYTENVFMSKINENLSSCKICKNFGERGGNFLSNNTYNIDVIFVAQNPGAGNFGSNAKPEDIVPFGLHNGFSGYNQFFKFFIESYKKNFNKEPIFYITNVVKCVTENNTIDDINMIDSCVNKFLILELTFLKKRNSNVKIVTLGKIARETFERKSDLLKYNPIYMHHPGYLNRKGHDYIKNEIDLLMLKLKSND